MFVKLKNYQLYRVSTCHMLTIKLNICDKYYPICISLRKTSLRAFFLRFSDSFQNMVFIESPSVYIYIPTYKLHHIILETLLTISFSYPIVSVFSVKPLVVPTGGQVQPNRQPPFSYLVPTYSKHTQTKSIDTYSYKWRVN